MSSAREVGKQALINKLEEYVEQRDQQKEYTHTVLFCIPVGFSKTVKLSAAHKMLNELNNKTGCTYNHDELDALRQGRLGGIIRGHSRFLPTCFTRDESVKAQWEIRDQERHALLRLGDGPYNW